MAVIVDAIQWAYSQKKDGTSPIKLRVQHRSLAKYFPIQYQGQSLSLTVEDWKAILSGRVKSTKRNILERIRDEETRARDIVEKITAKGKRPFSYGRFAAEYDQSSNELSFFKIFEKYLEGLMIEKRIGSFHAYNNAKVAFRDFIGKDVEVHEISVALLKGFERYLLNERKVGKEKQRSLGKNTVAMYMRSLKVIYNQAVTENPFLSEFYPFAQRRNESGKYQIRTAPGKKGDALSLDELRKFVNIEVEAGTARWEAKQYWLFSFYCQGMNFRDIAYIKPRTNLTESAITYTRRKTINTEREEAPIIIPLSESIRNILRDLNCNVLDERLPVFPILNAGMDIRKEDAAIKQKIKITNKWLRRLCKENGLPEITTYWARHSYASLLKSDGVPVDMIRELLGHSSSKTTEVYLRRFELDKIKNINQRIEKISSGL